MEVPPDVFLGNGSSRLDAGARLIARPIAGLEAQLLCEIVHHGFIGSAPDTAQARVDEGASRRAFLHVSVAAAELNALIGNPAADPGAKELGHADDFGGVLARDDPAHAGSGEFSRRSDFSQHLDELELSILHLGERLAEENAFFGPLARRFPDILGTGDAGYAGNQALILKLHHLLLKSAPDVPDGIGHRHPDIGQKRVGRYPTPSFRSCRGVHIEIPDYPWGQ